MDILTEVATIVGIFAGLVTLDPKGRLLKAIIGLWQKSHFLSILNLLQIIAIITLIIIFHLIESPSGLQSGKVPPTIISTPNDPDNAFRLKSIMHLIDQDVQAARDHSIQIVESIYAPDAIVTDAGCYLHSGTSYNGLLDIVKRYNNLPHFSALQHVNILIHWDPRQPTVATATSKTVGALAPVGNSKPQLLGGNEKWSFVLEDNQWLISRFTFNLCLEPL